jgi:hypothetical protein
MAAMPAVLDEASHAGERVVSRHAVQVAPVADDVLALFQFPDLATIDAVRDEIVSWFVRVFPWLWWVTGRTDSWSAAHAPARVRFKPDDVPHLSSECVGVGGGRVGPVSRGKLAAVFFRTNDRRLIHQTLRWRATRGRR